MYRIGMIEYTIPKDISTPYRNPPTSILQLQVRLPYLTLHISHVYILSNNVYINVYYYFILHIQ